MFSARMHSGEGVASEMDSIAHFEFMNLSRQHTIRPYCSIGRWHDGRAMITIQAKSNRLIDALMERPASVSEFPAATILVVDDDEMLREVLEAYLLREGYTVQLANSGEIALEFTAQTPPDLILLDARLSGIDGYEVCRRFRASPATRHMPIVMITALDNDEDKQHAIEAGVDDFIPKPFDSLVMLHRIRTLLRRKQLIDSLPEVLAHHVSESTAEAILQEIYQILD